MSCATSGNVGLTASLPLISMAEDLNASEEQLLRALAMSFLMTICVKNRIGRVSSMCACVTAASQGVAAGASMLLGGDLAGIDRAINNTVVNIFGVVCDGARLACALKLSSAIGIAIECAMMAKDDVMTPADQGIVGSDADDTLNFMGDFAQHLQRDRYNTEIYLLCMCDHITVDHHISGYSPVHIKNAVDGNRGADDILYHLAVYDGWICCIRTEKSH